MVLGKIKNLSIMCVIMYLLKMCIVTFFNESNFDKRRIYLGHFDLSLFPRRTVLEGRNVPSRENKRFDGITKIGKYQIC